MSEAVRHAVLAEARRWLATPYAHGASARGAGCDCLGLIRGIWRAIYGFEPEIPAYGPAWAEAGAPDRLLKGLVRHFETLPIVAAAPGDVLLFARGAGRLAAHLGVLSGHDRLIHAYARRGVVETRLTPALRRARVAAFVFPDRR